VGVDISGPMLRKARARVTELGLHQVEGLAVMDAEHMAFPNESFDVIVAQYVITTVSNPEGTLDEFARVLKPGGEIVLITRVGADNGPRALFEKTFTPLTHQLGWRLQFPWARYERWAERPHGMKLVERRPMPPFGHFSLVRFVKAPKAAAAQEALLEEAAIN
ncbi:MAG TPA: class I SAM-dependent methyltransferase, partial [Methylocella sp.]|nr:class I SAM-dependent methyltransferase [Methylocella sp.]